MSESLSPRGAPRPLTLELPTELTAAQAAAVIELLNELLDGLWAHYGVAVQEHLQQERVATTAAPLSDPPF